MTNTCLYGVKVSMSYGNYKYQNKFVNSTNNFVNSDNNINSSSIDEDMNIFEDSLTPSEKPENTLGGGEFSVSSLDKETQDEIISNFESQLEELQSDFNKTKNEKGWISGLWDGFKNLTGIGAGSNKTQEQIDKMKNAISDFKNGKIDFTQAYKNITDNELTDEELQKYTNGEVKPKALESVEKYSEGQKMSADIVGDIVSGIAAVGAVAAGIGIGAAVGAGVKTAVKASDCIGNDKEYSLKDAGYDAITGSINGALAPVTNALGGAAGTATMKALGMEALETSVKSAAITGGKEVIEEGAEAVIKQGGKQIAKRAVASTVDMAVDGSLSGAADGFSRALAEGRTEDLLSDSASGFVGGLIASPIIGGGFKIAGKAGSKLGKIVSSNTSDSLTKEISSETSDSISKNFSEELNTPAKPAKTITGSFDDIKATDFNNDVSSLDGGLKPEGNLSIDSASSADDLNTTKLNNDVSSLDSGLSKDTVPDNITETTAEKPADAALPENDLELQTQTDKVIKTPEETLKSIENSSYLCDLYDSNEKSKFLSMLTDDEQIKKVDDLFNKYGDKIYYSSADSIIGLANLDENQFNKLDELIKTFNSDEYKSSYKLLEIVKNADDNRFSELIDLSNKGFICDTGTFYDFAVLDSEEKFARAVDLYNKGVRSCDLKSYVDTEEIYNKACEIYTNEPLQQLVKDKKLEQYSFYKLIKANFDTSQVDNLSKLLDMEIESDKAINWVTEFNETQIDNIVTLVKHGMSTDYIEQSLKKYNDEQITHLAKLKEAKVSDYNAFEIINACMFNTSDIERLVQVKYEGFSDETAIKYAVMNHRSVGTAQIKNLDCEIKRAIKLKNAGFDEDNACVVSANIKNDTQIQKVINQKDTMIKAGFKKDIACQYAALLDTDSFERAKIFKNAGFDDFYACYYARSITDETQMQKIINNKNAMLEAKFAKESANYYATKVDSNSLERAKIFKDAGFNEYYACENALITTDNSQVQKAINNKNALFEVCSNEDFAQHYCSTFNKKDIELVRMFNDTKVYITEDDIISIIKLNKEDFDLSSCSFKEIMAMKNSVLSVKDTIDNLTITEDMNDVQKDAINKLKSLDYDTMLNNIYDNLHHTITPTEVSDDAIKSFSKGFLANNSNIETILGNTDFTKFSEGIPLEYNRTDFLSDISNIIKSYPSNDEQIALFKKLGIEIIKDKNGNITGYDGIINLDITPENTAEKELLDCATKFIKNNKIETGDNELDSVLNSLIEGFPEFINVIGKKQHETHNLSVDAHILQVLKEAVSNDAFNDLSDTDKTCLKLATVFHDIAKSEGVVDKAHPEASAFYVRNLLEKLPFSENIKDRVFELVKNHHWIEEYNTDTLTPDYTASLFRHKDDYTIAKIMAESDLKGVSDDFWQELKSSLDVERQQPVVDSLNKINSSGQLVFTNKIIKENLIPDVEYNGKKYKVIDFTKQSTPDDLSKVGFEPGTTKDNLRLFIHMADDKNLDTVMHLSDVAQGSFLCASEISLEHKPTYWEQKFGVSLEAENINIANIAAENQGSGYGKDFNIFSEIITGKESYLSDYRNNIPQIIKAELNLSDDEYTELFEQFAAFKHLSQIKDNEMYTFGDKSIQGSKIKEAIQTAQDSMISEEQNEANLYNPKVNAFVAKVDSIDEIPQEYLDFAEKYNLPIYLLGE